MRILDIDLDLFVNEPAYWKPPGQRLRADEYVPWTEAMLRGFLEKQCGLSRANPIPGKVVEGHHEAFLIWRDLVGQGRLQTPFEVVHADSHADLGMGDAGWYFLMAEHLHLPLHQRANPPIGAGEMNDGNFLAYALACRWISRLTYVHHPNGGDDLLAFHFKDFDPKTMILELKACDRQQLDRWQLDWRPRRPTYEALGVKATEPPIPFEMVASPKFKSSEPFDLLVLARSPEFTPVASDALVPVIEEFMQSI